MPNLRLIVTCKSDEDGKEKDKLLKKLIKDKDMNIWVSKKLTLRKLARERVMIVEVLNA